MKPCVWIAGMTLSMAAFAQSPSVPPPADVAYPGTIRLDVDACVGHGRCYALAPLTFLPDELGHCEVVDEALDEATGEAAGEADDRVRRAVAACPEGALRLEPDTDRP